jgi:hypothetical protein
VELGIRIPYPIQPFIDSAEVRIPPAARIVSLRNPDRMPSIFTRRCGRVLRKLADLVRHHGEGAAVLAGACRLDGGGQASKCVDSSDPRCLRSSRGSR